MASRFWWINWHRRRGLVGCGEERPLLETLTGIKPGVVKSLSAFLFCIFSAKKNVDPTALAYSYEMLSVLFPFSSNFRLQTTPQAETQPVQDGSVL